MAGDVGNIELTFRAKLDQLDADMAGARAKATAAADQMGDEMATRVGSKFSAVGDKIASAITPGRLIAAGAAIGGAGAVLTKLGDDSAKATAQLRTAIENAGGSYDELAPRIGKVSDKLIGLGIDDEDTARAMATLTTSTQDPVKALDSMALASDIAAAKHISLQSAADLLGKAYMGNGKAFKQFGIELSANAGPEERAAALAELSARVHGQAAAQADNFSTKMESLKIRAENVGEALGQKVGPALAVAGPAMAGVGGIIQSGVVPALISGIASAASFAGGMIASGVSAAAAAIPVIIAWAPVILLVAAVGAAAYLLWQNWDEVWGFIKGAAAAAWDWIRTHLELIAMIVLAPVAPLILLVTHFDEAWSAISGIVGAAWGWLRDTISSGVDDVVSFVASLPGRAIDALASLGGMLADLAASAMSWLLDALVSGGENVIGFYVDLPGRILGALGDLAGMLWDSGFGMMAAFAEGIWAGMGRVLGAVGGVLKKARDLLPFSDAKTGPLSDLTLSGRRLPETFAKGIRSSSAISDALHDRFDLLQQAMVPPSLLDLAGSFSLGDAGPPSSPGGPVTAPSITNIFNEKVSPLHVAREVAWAMGS